MLYIGENGRRFGTKQKEHKNDMEQLEGVKYTTARRKESLLEIHQSTLTDHVVSKNHNIKCVCVRHQAKELAWKKRREEKRSHLHQEDRNVHHLPGRGVLPSS